MDLSKHQDGQLNQKLEMHGQQRNIFVQRGQSTKVEQNSQVAVLQPNPQEKPQDNQKISDVYELPITVVNNVVYENLLSSACNLDGKKSQ